VSLLDRIRALRLSPGELRRRALVAEGLGHPFLALLYREEAEAQEVAARVPCGFCGGRSCLDDIACPYCHPGGMHAA
jgi:hypothetical protein